MESVELRVTAAAPADLAALADVAARTFPTACPPSVTPQNVAAFIDENLSESRFADYLADPDRRVLTARRGDRIIGYAMLIRGITADDDVRRAVTLTPAVEISKLYVLADHHGGGVAAMLMSRALTDAEELGAVCAWLGVNQNNQRAQRFYAKHGFVINGTKTFRLGTRIESDYVMVRPLP